MNNKNKYNPNIHHRRSIRLKGYDYTLAGLYFITICCQDKVHRFGHVANGVMILNAYGQIAYDEWAKLTKHFPNMVMDVFQIMPNHMHGIIALTPVGATLAVAHNDAVTHNDHVAHNDAVTQNDAVAHNDHVAHNDDIIDTGDFYDDNRTGASPAPTGVSDIVGAYKSLVANGCLDIYKSNNKMMGKLWQRNYYEHVIRDERSYQNISNYIINNPSKWAADKFNK